MDPASIVGLVASVIAVADVAVKCRRKLSDLKARYRNIPQEVTTLIGHLHIVQAALDELSIWSSSDLSRNPRYQDLAASISMSLESFGPLILSLYDHLDKLDTSQASNVTVMSAISFIWNKRDVSYYLTLIDRQVNALNLLLSAIQCSTWAEQRQIIDDQDSQTILQLAKECTPSIEALADASSAVTRNTNAISIEFDFDNILSASRVYIAAHRSHLKQAIKSTPPPDTKENNDSDPRLDPSTDANDASVDQASIALDETHASMSTAHSESLIQLHPTRNDSEAERATVTVSHEQISLHNNASNTSSTEHRTNQDVRPRPGLRQWPGGLFPRTLRANLRRRRSNNLSLANDRSDAIDAQLKRDRAARAKEVKVLLLGTHQSGKSTLLRAMKIAAKGALSEDEQQCMISEAMIWLITMAQGVLEDEYRPGSFLDDAGQNAQAKVLNLRDPWNLSEEELSSPDVFAAIKSVWEDKDFVRKFATELGYPPAADSTTFCLEALVRLTAKNHDSIHEDLLKLYGRRTVGTTETSLNVDDTQFRVFDVGGIRSERKKWVHCFDDTDFVILHFDATSFCKSLVEDRSTNRFDEEIMLYESLVDTRWLLRVHFILLINRCDLVEEVLSFEFPENVDTRAGRTIFDCFPELVEKRYVADKKALAELYIQCLERKLLSIWDKNDRLNSRIALIRANLVDHKTSNPVKEVFDIMLDMRRMDEERSAATG